MAAEVAIAHDWGMALLIRLAQSGCGRIAVGSDATGFNRRDL